jgi:hypothetical protein
LATSFLTTSRESSEGSEKPCGPAGGPGSNRTPFTPSSRFGRDEDSSRLSWRSSGVFDTPDGTGKDTAARRRASELGAVAGRLCKEEGQRRPAVPTLFRNAQLFFAPRTLDPARGLPGIRRSYLGYDEVNWNTTNRLDARRGCLGCGGATKLSGAKSSGMPQGLPRKSWLHGNDGPCHATKKSSRSRIGPWSPNRSTLWRGEIVSLYAGSREHCTIVPRKLLLAEAFVCTHSMFRLLRLKRIVGLW